MRLAQPPPYNRPVRRPWIALVILLAVLAGATVAALLWWRSSPPRSARLLPEADGYFYLDLGVLRRAGALNQLPPVIEDREYRDFVEATGFRFERDVDSVALAIHGQAGFDSAALDALRFTDVFSGRIDRVRASTYLRSIAQHTESYRGREVFYIAHQGVTSRVAFLDDGHVALSNAGTDAPLHSTIDKFVERGFAAPAPLLREFYGELPAASLAWLIARTSEPAGRRHGALLSSELQRTLGGSTMLASARFLGSLDVSVEAIAPTERKAGEIAQNAGTLLQLFGITQQQVQPGGGDADIKAVLSSLQVSQQGRRVILTAEVPVRVLKKLTE
ncbi:MAG: hypothetical protein JO041_15130 [Acidobacteria bacterium]|nr:hypothetical protein [Acidobacteriota bacterium]